VRVFDKANLAAFVKRVRARFDAAANKTAKTDDKLLAGCQSRVWLYLEGEADRISIRANSDAAIVSGLIALLTRVYSGCSARQIVETEPYFIREIGLADHLSPTRANGLHAMLKAIREHAQSLL